MRTMQPSVTLGSYTWAQDRLPFDEFTLRLENLYAAMDQNGWKAMLVYGDVREHAALAFLSNFIPRVRWGMALLPRSGDARLVCAMSTRDLPAMRGLTWIADATSGMGPEWTKSFDPWFEQFKSDSAIKLGTLGFDFMAPVLFQSVRNSLGERFVLQKADDILRLASRPKRPRELTMVRATCKVLDAAAKTFAESWRKNHAPETAALDAERVARSLAAQDVRTLISLDGGRTLVPYQGLFEQKAGSLVGYIAVKVAGYWADMFITVNDGDAGPAARTRRGRARCSHRGSAARRDFRKTPYGCCRARCSPLRFTPALSESVGHGIGLSLQEEPTFCAAENAALVEDGIYTLQVGTADAKAGQRPDFGNRA